MHCSSSTSVLMHELIFNPQNWKRRWVIYFCKYFIFPDVLECCPISSISLLSGNQYQISTGRDRASGMVAKYNPLKTCYSQRHQSQQLHRLFLLEWRKPGETQECLFFNTAKWKDYCRNRNKRQMSRLCTSKHPGTWRDTSSLWERWQIKFGFKCKS